SGTTTMPSSPARSAGRLAALSVTTLTNRTSLRLRRVSPTSRVRPASPVGFSTQMTYFGQSDDSKVLHACWFRRSLHGHACYGTFTFSNVLILATSYVSIPFASALFTGLRLGVRHIPSAIPFGNLMRQHPTAFAFFFDAATFLVSAAMISRVQIPKHDESKTL